MTDEDEYTRYALYAEARADTITDEEKQGRYRDWRCSWAAMTRGLAFEKFVSNPSYGVKSGRRE